MRFARYTLAVVAILGMAAAPAAAQVDVRVKVDTKAIKEAAEEMRAALQSALGPEFRRDLEGAVRDIAGAFEGLGHFDWDLGDWGQSQRYRATQTDRETRRFNVGAGGQLDLETLSGDVTVRRGSGREVVIEIIREAHGTTDATAKAGLADVRVVSEERGGRVTVKTVYPDRRHNSDYSVSVNYIVSAPAGTSVSTQSLSGDISIDGIEGELSVSTKSGDIVITGANRLTSAGTLSGDIKLTNVAAEGLLEASTMSGDIVASGIKARRVDLGTISGSVTARGVDAGDVKLHSMTDDVVFEGPLATRGRYEFSSHTGDVSLTLDGRTGFSFEASTFSGSVQSELALQGSRATSRTLGSRRSSSQTGETRSLNGTFGDGSAVITATSFSGSVVVTKK